MTIVRSEYLLLATLGLAACGGESDEAPPAPVAGQELTSPASAGSVVRAPAAPVEAPPPPAPAETVIQTQEGSPGHIHVDLTRAQVTGDILMVQLRFRNTSPDRYTAVRFPVDEVSYIEDASARRYGVLMDEADSPMASPLSGDHIVLRPRPGSSEVAWFRFAAPDPQSPTISINIPKVGPFDGIPVSR